MPLVFELFNLSKKPQISCLRDLRLSVYRKVFNTVTIHCYSLVQRSEPEKAVLHEQE